MAELLPVLVADLNEVSARDFLEEVARENEEAWVPLVAAPMDASKHLLEVYTPSAGEPLRLLAHPTGPPTEHGFPLRLSLLTADDDESLSVPTREHVAVGLDVTIEHAGAPSLELHDPLANVARESPRVSFARSDTPTLPRAGTPRRPTPLFMSEEHTAELAGTNAPSPSEPPAVASAPASVADGLVGRAIAGGKLQIESLVGTGMMGAVYKALHREVGSSRVDLQACKLEYSIVSPK